ncbi:MAG: hypothetical protein ACJAS4_002383 [Bacteriovoracaceae bacterium]|jgi:hypothetical protein
MKNLLLSGLVALSMIACNSGGGGSGGGSTGGGGSVGGGGTIIIDDYTHEEIAALFVSSLNLDADFDVTLVKDNTLEVDYIVIYDPYTDSYDAVNLSGYDPDLDIAADYYYNNSAASFFDLNIVPGHYETDYNYEIIGYDIDGYAVYDYVAYDTWIPTRYADPNSNFIFEKTAATPKDLAKISALKEVAQLQKSATFLSKEFGLSLGRSQEVARLATHWKKASIKGMTAAEQDSFSTELLGFSITAGKKAAKEAMEGNASSLESLVKNAAAQNSITPEHATKLMTKMFGM